MEVEGKGEEDVPIVRISFHRIREGLISSSQDDEGIFVA